MRFFCQLASDRMLSMHNVLVQSVLKMVPPLGLTPFGSIFGTVYRGFGKDFVVFGQHNFRIRVLMKFLLLFKRFVEHHDEEK